MADQPQNQVLLDAAELLKTTQEAIYDALKDSHNMLAIGMKTKLGTMINQLNMIAGNTNAIVDSSVERFEAKPITEFMGEPINTPKKVQATDLSPKELEKKIFNDKIDRLHDGLENLTNEQVLEGYMNDQIVIRGLAKRVGLTDFKEAQINGDYIDEIRQAKKDQADFEVRKKNTESQIPSGQK